MFDNLVHRTRRAVTLSAGFLGEILVRTLKAFLALLVAAAVLPGLLFGTAVSWWLAHELRASTEHEARAAVAQMAANVGEHVHLTVTAMKALAQSPALARDDLEEAYRFAGVLAADLGQHVGLARADGQQLFNTRRPFGTALPRRAEATSYTRALRTGKPSVSNVIVGAIAGRPLVTIDVPVPSSQGSRVLGTSTDLSVIGAVMARTSLAEDWRASVVDANGVLVAQAGGPLAAGDAAPEDVARVARSGQTNGSFGLDDGAGNPMLGFFVEVPGTDWTAVVTIPRPALLVPSNRSLAALGIAGVAAVLLTLVAAVLLGRKLDTAARRLTEDARAMAEGRPPAAPRQTIAEFGQVEAVLHEADRQSRAREAELAQARDTAQQSVEAKNRLFASASHDMRQPLNAAGWCIELLRQKVKDPGVDRYLEGLEQTHATMTSLITGLFDIAKLDAEGGTLATEPVALHQLVREVFAECRPLAEEKGLELRLRPFAECTVDSDRDMLARMLRNLVHNAIRYTEAGTVTLACRRRGGSVWLEVWDTGVGIPRDQLDLIWEEFYRVGNRHGGKGSGLGLSIVRRLAAALGCRVRVRSRLGAGSVFRIVIPDAA